jgi:4-hydroxy-2-oxoheptanedioate aldolase
MLTTNTFKQALKDGKPQIGLWHSLANAYVAEALSTTGFDWLVVDGEHAPNDLNSMLAQLQAMAPYKTHPVVRPMIGDVAVIKQLLEIGAQTLLIPMVAARSSRWSAVPRYVHQADDQMCVLVQVETKTGLANLAEIAAVEGVDGVFFGPADLSASMGYLGETGHPEVVAAMTKGIKTILAAGKAPGILMTDNKSSQYYLDQGALFVAVGVDAMLLIDAAKTLVATFKGGPVADGPNSYA